MWWAFEGFQHRRRRFTDKGSVTINFVIAQRTPDLREHVRARGGAVESELRPTNRIVSREDMQASCSP